MGLGSRMDIADRFATYVGTLTKVIGHADREGPLRDYCSGLLATEGRRSVEPMAAVTAPARVSAQHQKFASVEIQARPNYFTYSIIRIARNRVPNCADWF
jgi:SRSO17 transposase